MSLPGFEVNNGLESFRRRDISSEMSKVYGERYRDYRRRWAACPPVLSRGPLHLDIDLRDSCNLSCVMCHQAYRKRTNSRIDPMLLQRVITEAAELELRAINFGASAEPLLEPELLFNALECVKNVGIMDSFIHTNGILLTEEVSRRLLSSGLKHVCISLDAATAQTYAKIRKSNAFERIERNILNLIRLRDESNNVFPEVRVSFCVIPENTAEKGAFAEKWTNRADLVEFQTYRHVDGSEVKYGNGIVGGGKHSCSEGIKRSMLWPSGMLSPCCAGWEGIEFGDLNNDSLENIWNSTSAQRIRMMLSESKNVPSLCIMCLSGH